MKEDFISLEDYVNKEDTERKVILDNAGLTIEDIDADIAQFLGTNEIFGAFIRGIIMKCIELKTAKINEEVGIYLDSLKM